MTETFRSKENFRQDDDWLSPAPLTPTLASVTPNSIVSLSGTVLTLVGSGFLDGPNPIVAVIFQGPAPSPGSYAALTFTVVSDTEMTMPTSVAGGPYNGPQDPGSYTVQIGDGGAGSNKLPFTITAA